MKRGDIYQVSVSSGVSGKREDMKSLRLTAALSVALATAHGASAVATQLSSDQASVLADARAYALEYSQKLPDFICTQITHRNTSSLHSSEVGVTGSGLPAQGQDKAASSSKVEERLTYFAQQEHYDVIAIDGKKVPGARHLEMPGAVSSGEFGSAIREIFDPVTQTAFTFDRMASLRGKPVYVIAFEVPSNPGALVYDAVLGQQIFASYRGRVFLDPDTKRVLRIDTHLNLPPEFPIELIERTVEYKPVNIASNYYYLPFHAEVVMRERGVSYSNEIDFKAYQKFTVESTIHFDSAEPQR
jgi:hypothetical protein